MGRTTVVYLRPLAGAVSGGEVAVSEVRDLLRELAKVLPGEWHPCLWPDGLLEWKEPVSHYNVAMRLEGGFSEASDVGNAPACFALLDWVQSQLYGCWVFGARDDEYSVDIERLDQPRKRFTGATRTEAIVRAALWVGRQ
jgi:hypothetical protein